MAEFLFERPNVKKKKKKRFSYCIRRMKSKLSLPSECVYTKHCKLCTHLTSNLHGERGMVWYRTSRVKQASSQPTILALQASVEHTPGLVGRHGVHHACLEAVMSIKGSGMKRANITTAAPHHLACSACSSTTDIHLPFSPLTRRQQQRK